MSIATTPARVPASRGCRCTRTVFALLAIAVSVLFFAPSTAAAQQPVEPAPSLLDVFIRIFWPPADAESLPPTVAPCPLEQVGPAGGTAHSLRLGVTEALRAQGAAAETRMIAVEETSGGAMHSYYVRLGAGNAPLLPRECYEALAAEGRLQEGSVEGARYLLLGALQQQATRSRVTARIVDVETGGVIVSGRGDADGIDAGAIARAAAAAIGALDTPLGTQR